MALDGGEWSVSHPREIITIMITITINNIFTNICNLFSVLCDTRKIGKLYHLNYDHILMRLSTKLITIYTFHLSFPYCNWSEML
jgi:hypothetical protein